MSIISFNKEKALNLIQQRIREERLTKFQELDVQYMRALESGDIELQQSIVQQKQVLRDLTDIDVTDVETIEDIKKKWPESELGIPLPFDW